MQTNQIVNNDLVRECNIGLIYTWPNDEARQTAAEAIIEVTVKQIKHDFM